MDTEDWNELECYLIKQYGVIQDKNWLKSVSEIEDYFTDSGGELLECGQGYYQDETEVIVYIANKFYRVVINAEIGSAKQDRGDRLYWVEGINNVTYEEIEKPERKIEYVNIKVSEDKLEVALELLKSKGIEVKKY